MGEIGGTSRHASTQPAPMPVVWTCPACGQKGIQTPLSLGCPTCGAGAPGVHLVETGRDPDVPEPSDDAAQAFVDWSNAQKRSLPPDLVALCWSAFKAGLDYAMTHGENPKLGGSAESRTLHAALALFIDNVLAANPDEVKAGEWLSAEEARKVLKRLEGV